MASNYNILLHIWTCSSGLQVNTNLVLITMSRLWFFFSQILNCAFEFYVEKSFNTCRRTAVCILSRSVLIVSWHPTIKLCSSLLVHWSIYLLYLGLFHWDICFIHILRNVWPNHHLNELASSIWEIKNQGNSGHFNANQTRTLTEDKSTQSKTVSSHSKTRCSSACILNRSNVITDNYYTKDGFCWYFLML